MKNKIEIGDIFTTNTYGDIKILKKLEKGYFLVRFIDTGYEVTANRANIFAGKVRDKLKTHHTVREWEDTHIEMVSNSGDKFTVVRRNSKKCIVVFEDTKYTTEAYWANVEKGKIIDPYKKTVLGIGYLGEFKKVSYWKKAKQLWQNMMKRCYNKNDSKGYYGKCFVDQRWHCFSNFLEDIKHLDNFEQWNNFDKTGVKYNLDKDLKIPGNNIYSKLHCSFQMESLNKGATSRNNYYRG